MAENSTFNEAEFLALLGELKTIARSPEILVLKKEKAAIHEGKLVWIVQYNKAFKKVLVSPISRDERERIGSKRSAEISHSFVDPAELTVSTD